MLPEVEIRGDKLVQAYSDVEARMQAVISNHVIRRPLVRRDQMRAVATVQAISDASISQRTAEGAGLLRMAYVRGGRSVNGDFRMDEDDLAAVEVLTAAFLRGLRMAERAVLIQAQTAFRFVSLGQQARKLVEKGAVDFTVMADFFAAKATANPGRPLEQYARAAVTFASVRAFDDGEVSATERYS